MLYSKIHFGWYYYVYNENYNLMSIDELKNFIKNYKRLPEITSEKEIILNGIDVAEMNKILVKKIEELTLYIIRLHDEIN